MKKPKYKIVNHHRRYLCGYKKCLLFADECKKHNRRNANAYMNAIINEYYGQIIIDYILGK